MSNQTKGFTLAITGAILWGASGTCAQFFFAHNTVSTQWVVTLRLLVSGIILVCWSLLTVKNQVKPLLCRKNIGLLLLFSFLGMLPSQLTYFMAVRLGNAPTATILQYISPVFVIVYLAVRTRKLPSRVAIISILLALLGVLLLVTRGKLNELALSPAALFWGIAAGLGAAAYTLLPRKLLAQFDAKLVTGLAMLIAGLAMSPILITSPVPHLTKSSLLSLLFIIIFGTMFAYLFFISSLNYIPPTTTSLLGAFEPLMATVLTVVFLQMPIALPEIIGGLLILSTTFIQALVAKRAQLKR
jgi:drug/metabolite transporter (DMT)-like permease